MPKFTCPKCAKPMRRERTWKSKARPGMKEGAVVVPRARCGSCGTVSTVESLKRLGLVRE